MSTRTIIEINHDRLSALGKGGNDDVVWDQLVQALAHGMPPEDMRLYFAACGIRILGQRHHSEPEWVQGRA